MDKQNKMVILTGPSCAGKTPLEKSLRQLYPQISEKLKRIVAYNTRAKRPMETDGVDYHFRSRIQIRQLERERKIILIEARGDLHGIDIAMLHEILKSSDAFYEGNTFMAREIINVLLLEETNLQTIFLSPFSASELAELIEKYDPVALRDHVFNCMMQKLTRRAQNFGIEFTNTVFSNLKHRAADAYDELRMANLFDHIIINQDGEDSPNWDDPKNLKGDALASVKSLADLIVNGHDPLSENWSHIQLPE